jgi:hypothetical protein
MWRTRHIPPPGRTPMLTATLIVLALFALAEVLNHKMRD